MPPDRSVLTWVMWATACTCPHIPPTSGVATDQWGVPVPGAQVRRDGTGQTTTAGPDGTYVFEGQPGEAAGEQCLRGGSTRFSAEGCSGLYTLACCPTVSHFTYAGQVVDAVEGTPLEGIRLVVGPLDSPTLEATSDADGAFVTSFVGTDPTLRPTRDCGLFVQAATDSCEGVGWSTPDLSVLPASNEAPIDLGQLPVTCTGPR